MSEKDAGGTSGPVSQDSQDSASKRAAASNALMHKIMDMLTSAAADTWRLGGADLTPELRLPGAVKVYHQILVRDIPNGSLVLHLTQPVVSVYAPGGYQITPTTPPRYTVEARDRLFDANKAVDPKYADVQKGKRCDVIATGDVAKALFLQVRDIVRKASQNLQKTFDESTRKILDSLLDRIEQTPFSEWEKKKEEVGEEDVARYITKMEGISVSVSALTNPSGTVYSVLLTQDRFNYETRSGQLPKQAFEKLEDKDQSAQLEALGKTLVDLGLDSKKEES